MPPRAWIDPHPGRPLHQALGTQAATQIVCGQAVPCRDKPACIAPSLARVAAARRVQSCAAAAWAKTRRTDSPLPPSAGGEVSTSSAACLSAIERTMDMPSP